MLIEANMYRLQALVDSSLTVMKPMHFLKGCVVRPAGTMRRNYLLRHSLSLMNELIGKWMAEA